MPGRAQALMRTRCPACSTVFRVTSEQLRLKAGKVRCGQCQTVFNAFDEFLPEDHSPASRTQPPAGVAEDHVRPPDSWPAIMDPEPCVDEGSTASVGEDLPAPPDDLPLALFSLPEAVMQPSVAPAARPVDDESADRPTESAVLAPLGDDALPDDSPATTELPAVVELPAGERPPEENAMDSGAVTEPLPETQEESTQAARQAGLVAARELAESPAYNRWAAGTLADGGASSFAQPPARRLVWPFVVVALLLALGLLLQLLLHFRSDVVRWLPAAGAYYQQAGISVPLPRNPDLVVIEASDLQADNARGLFVLQATLKNRANYAQDWPALELTLTDASDSVVARRVMTAADYLPATISPEVFPANGEVAVHLWIEARNLGAAGYRLYVFYP